MENVNDHEEVNLSVMTPEVVGKLLLAVDEIRAALGLPDVDWWGDSYGRNPLSHGQTSGNRHIIARTLARALAADARSDPGIRKLL